MKKIISFLCLCCIFTSAIYAQNEANPESKFLIGLHYVSNIDNENFLSENYNGIIGVDARYNFLTDKILKLQGGISYDFLSGKNENELDLKYNTMNIVNPNLGCEFNFFNTNFRPFANLGYAFINYSYTIQFSSLKTYDPLVNPYSIRSLKNNFNENSFSLQPGFRYIFEKSIYVETSYKYLPINKNFNMHFFNIGLGVHF